MIVVDTNVVSELMRPAPSAAVVTWMRVQVESATYTTAVTLAEIRYGIARLPAGRRRTRLSESATGQFSRFANRVLPFGAEDAAPFGDVVAERARMGRPMMPLDAQIAAICRSRGAMLATRNTADFSDLGVDLIDPWQTAARQ